MAGKKVSFGTKPKKQPDVDAWVESRDIDTEVEAAEKPTSVEEDTVKAKKGNSDAGSKGKSTSSNPTAMKRLTLDIPEPLHRRIKGRAVMEGVTMVNMLRKLLEEIYG